MGAGFALFLPETAVSDTVKIAEQLGIQAVVAGRVESGRSRF